MTHSGPVPRPATRGCRGGARNSALAAVALAVAASLAACSSDDQAERASIDLEDAPADQQLAEVCGDEIRVQLQWQPQSDMGALFQMLGPDYLVDESTKSVTGTLVSGGLDTGVDLTLLAGGPAIGFQSVTSQMYVDEEIDLGLVHSDQLISASGEQPVVGVTPLLTHSPAMLMWDPETYGEEFDLTELPDTDAVVVVSKEQAYPAWLVKQGYVRADQIDPSYDGNPARFVGDPTIVQQGFANSEPYGYEHDTPAWNKPVAFQLLSEIGYDPYASNLSVRADRLEDMAPCLSRLVPIVQQAGVDYITDPGATNDLIVDVVASDQSYSPYSIEEATYSSELLRDRGLIAEENETFGGYDPARLTQFVTDVAPIVREQGSAVPQDITADDLFSGRFVDPSVGMP